MNEDLANIKTGRHLYNRGWLCLIPLIGAFAGAYLLLLGIARYKNKKLILIGIDGILFTVLIYGSIYYRSVYTKSGKQEWAILSQMMLNDLVRDVEFYKIQYGSYPDSLIQLQTENKIAPIHDPLSALPGKRQTFFYYEKTGEKYKLFSPGIDGIVNTPDDLFPQVDHAEKTGLIRPERR